jgi:carboxyl-terminal processing protease
MHRRFLVALFLLLAPTLGRAEDLPPTSGEKLLSDAVNTCRRNWWDRENRDKIDWKGLIEKHREQAKHCATPLEAHHVVNEALGELHTSHLALMEGDVYDRELDPEFQGKRTLRAAIEISRLDQGYFVDAVLEGSPAEKAGLRLGDEVVTIDGVKTSESSLLEDAGHDPGLTLPPSFVLSVKKDEEIRLQVRHEKGGKLTDVTFAPKELCMLDAARASVRVIERDGKTLGVVHLWHFMSSEMNTVLREAIKGPLAHCDGLVLDVRGRGGRANVITEVMSNFQGSNPRWKKSVVVLQDHGTRSAKEIFAWSWKQKKLGKIVGEKTLGAVIGCMFKKLFDGSVLMYPAQDVRPMTKGEQLEGHGIDPDVAVEVGDLRWKNGQDPILEKGISVLLQEIREFKAPAPAPGRWL